VQGGIASHSNVCRTPKIHYVFPRIDLVCAPDVTLSYGFNFAQPGTAQPQLHSTSIAPDMSRPKASPRLAFKTSAIRVCFLSVLLYLINSYLIRLSPAAYSVSFLASHSIYASQQSYVKPGLVALWAELVRDGPIFRAAGEWSEIFVTQVPATVAYLVPIALSSVLLPTRHNIFLAALLLLRCAWTISVFWASQRIWRNRGRGKLSWMLVGLAGYFWPDWRPLVLWLASQYWPMWSKSAILTSATHPRYSYTPIPSDRKQIRLLEISPWPARLLPLRLRCSLVHYDLDAAPPFEAISYRWGAVGGLHQVIIDGRALAISKSAHDILHRRASIWRARRLWIDAICVDQSSDNDRTHQVSMMRDIYDRAARTIVHLSANALDAWLTWAFFGNIVWMPGGDSSVAAFGLKRINDKNPKWTAIGSMLENEYWSRVWIVQEIVVSRQVDILYGGRWFDWNLFAPTIMSLHSESPNGLLQKLDQSEGMATPPFARIRQIGQIEKLREEYRQGELWTLPCILANFGASQATDDRDYVFAFQGISTAYSERALVPDYSKEALHVFREATQYALMHPPVQNSLLMLSIGGLSHARSEVHDWPSWVPDFRRISRLVNRSVLLHSHAPYQAGSVGVVAPLVRPGPNSNEVIIAGILVDSVAVMTSLPLLDAASRWTGLGESGSEEEKSGLELVLHHTARYREARALCEAHSAPVYQPTGQPRLEAFWRTYICNRSLDSYPAGSEYGGYLQAYMTDMERYGEAMKRGRPQDALLPEELQSAFSSAAFNPQAATGGTETLVQTIEKLLPVEDLGGINIANFLTPSLLAGGPGAIFEELAALTNLPYSARTEVRNHLLSVASTPESNPKPLDANPQFGKAVEELLIRSSQYDPQGEMETPVKRIVLLIAFLLLLPNPSGGGQNASLSHAQVNLLRQAAERNQATNDVMAKRIGLLLGGTSGQRQFAVTREGKYMGLVPADTREGDVLVVFLGSKVPHVLRKAEGARYTLIGEAYVHGLMDGEVFVGSQLRVEGITLI